MRTRTLKKWLTTMTVLFLAGAVVAVVLGLKAPIDAPGIRAQPDTEPTAISAPVDTRRVPDLDSLQRLAKRDIRQRLFDPPAKPEPVIPPKPPPAVRLMGTIVNAANPQAMIAGAGGKVELKRVGDTVGDAGNTAVIKEIYSDHIKIEHEGKTLDVAIAEGGGRTR